MDNINDREKLMYLLYFMSYYIEQDVYRVLNDSEEDPHYSAVTTTNLLKCYIDVMNACGEELPYTEMKSFFEYLMLTKAEFKKFELSRNKEAEYYVGKIY